VTILLEILVVAAIVFGAVAYASGFVEGMRPAPPDSGEVGLPDGELNATAIDRTRFGLAFRGYRMAEVDAVLDRLRDEVARRDAQGAPVAVRDGDGAEQDWQPNLPETETGTLREPFDRPVVDLRVDGAPELGTDGSSGA
jgi:DivIVA domain-containing protein